jgi:hypothetical protein
VRRGGEERRRGEGSLYKIETIIGIQLIYPINNQ